MSGPHLHPPVVGDGFVSLTWDEYAGAESYRVRRRSGSGAWQFFAEVSATELLDDTVANGVTYEYLVSAIVESEPSGIVSATPTGPAPTRPNLLVFMTDDQPPASLAHMPKAAAAFADRAVRFTDHHASHPLCGPARATLLTGRYSHHHGVRDNASAMQTMDFSSTLFTALRDAGYRVGLFGKLMNEFDPGQHEAPPGLDVAWIVRSIASPAYYGYSALDCPAGTGPGTVVTYGTSDADYGTNQISARAIDFIQATPADQPFACFLHFSAPHEVTVPHADDAGTHASEPVPQPPNFNEDTSDKGAAWLRNKNAINPAGLNYPRMLDTLASVDRAIEEVTAALAERGPNTVVVFLADNPSSLGAHRHNGKNATLGAFTRCHLWITAPDIAPGCRTDAGLTSDVRVAATLADYAGATLSPAPDLPSLRPRLVDPQAPLPASILLQTCAQAAPPGGIPVYRPAARALRTSAAHPEGAWLWVEYAETGEAELFALGADPYEVASLWNSAAHAGVRDALASELAGFGGVS